MQTGMFWYDLESEASLGFNWRLVSSTQWSINTSQPVSSISLYTGSVQAGKHLWWSSLTAHVKKVRQMAALTHTFHTASLPSTTHQSTTYTAATTQSQATSNMAYRPLSWLWLEFKLGLWRYRNHLFGRFLFSSWRHWLLWDLYGWFSYRGYVSCPSISV